MSLLRAASLRHLWRHPAQLALALVGLALGVGTIVAVDVAIASAGRAFELSVEAVNGAATHRIVGGPHGIDERLYVRLRTQGQPWGAARPQLAPVVAGYVSAGDRLMQLVGLDPLASAALGPSARPGASALESLIATVPASVNQARACSAPCNSSADAPGRAEGPRAALASGSRPTSCMSRSPADT